MTTTDLGYLVQFAFLIGAAFFALGLHLMNSPATARERQPPVGNGHGHRRLFGAGSSSPTRASGRATG